MEPTEKADHAPPTVGERMFIRCIGGPDRSRLQTYPPALEIVEDTGTYVLVDDGPIHEWVYEFVPRR